MTMQTVYDADGKAIQLEPVDAKEYLESGSYFAKPKGKAKPADVAADSASADVGQAEVTDKARGKPGPKPKD